MRCNNHVQFLGGITSKRSVELLDIKRGGEGEERGGGGGGEGGRGRRGGEGEERGGRGRRLKQFNTCTCTLKKKSMYTISAHTALKITRGQKFNWDFFYKGSI